MTLAKRRTLGFLGFSISEVKTSHKISHPCQNLREGVFETRTVFVTMADHGTVHTLAHTHTCTVYAYKHVRVHVHVQAKTKPHETPASTYSPRAPLFELPTDWETTSSTNYFQTLRALVAKKVRFLKKLSADNFFKIHTKFIFSRKRQRSKSPNFTQRIIPLSTFR